MLFEKAVDKVTTLKLVSAIIIVTIYFQLLMFKEKLIRSSSDMLSTVIIIFSCRPTYVIHDLRPVALRFSDMNLLDINILIRLPQHFNLVTSWPINNF